MVKAPLKPRLVALGLDYLVILGWLAVLSRLFGASLLADDLLITGLTRRAGPALPERGRGAGRAAHSR
ncbi:hypothetical protein [Nonomuraea sp. NPDC050540]|uniref:hypothetical protein n=1 Tax=Nonomuraea sp. NPDC050540 TaxID=3364367 RepID=UPI00378BF17F